ncbi:MAG: hypothetical protein ACXQTY_02890 [Candidatus Methanogasteraceae archaeon]|nr:hypothetical protein [Euryarchaeota archaeon]
MTENDQNKLEGYFKTGLFMILMFLTLIATFQFYFAVQDVIGIWFEYEYESIFGAAFSFTVIVVCIYLIRSFIVSRN